MGLIKETQVDFDETEAGHMHDGTQDNGQLILPDNSFPEDLMIHNVTTTTTTYNTQLMIYFAQLTIERSLELLNKTYTIDITTTGANGRDVSAALSVDWYYLWIITNNDGTLNASFASRKQDGLSPALPTSYTQKKRIGEFYNDVTGIRRYTQVGREVNYADEQIIITNYSTRNVWIAVGDATVVPAGIAHTLGKYICTGTTLDNRSNLVTVRLNDGIMTPSQRFASRTDAGAKPIMQAFTDKQDWEFGPTNFTAHPSQDGEIYIIIMGAQQNVEFGVDISVSGYIDYSL